MSKPDEMAQTTFRDAMRRLAATVNIITVKSGKERHGTVATAVTSLTMDPPALLVCINKTSRLHPFLTRATHFGVNILHTDHAAIANAFAAPIEAEERFANGTWTEGEAEVPCLDDAQAALVCHKESTLDYGTHTIFLGKVIGGHVREDIAPLLYMDGKYAACADLKKA